ncbi:UNVERIFIED_CONTAM: hypothetical protein Sindi_0854900 [Sesamum indicum]
MDEILNILPDLHKDLTYLKLEVTNLKRDQRESPQTSRSRQEQIRDTLGTISLLQQKEKATEIPRPKTREVNIQTNKMTLALPPLEENRVCNDLPQDHPIRESINFHTNVTPTFVGTRLRENQGRNPRKAPEHMPWASMLQPLHRYGAVLNLDVIDFQNIKKLINEWVAAIKIAVTTLQVDKENFIKLVELSLGGSMNIE